MGSEHAKRRIGAVDTTCNILNSIRKLRGATVTELAEEVGVTPGTVHTHLATLQEQGLVVKEGTTYRLGIHLVVLGEYVKNRSQLYQAAKEYVDDLATETGECVHLFAYQKQKGFLLYESYGENASGTRLHDQLRERPYQPICCSAGGKAILAHLPDEEVDDVIDTNGLPQMTQNTVTDRDVLFDELETIRERGIAFNDEELLRGQRAVGAPILNSKKRALGAISLSAPRSRLTGETFRVDIPAKISEATNLVERSMESSEVDL